MNHLLLMPLLLVLTVSAYAQILTPLEVITKDGSAVILKPDGTWEFKKAVPQSARIPAVNIEKPEASTDSLPSNFTGVDPKILHERLTNLREQLIKNEFETTAQYNKRVAEEIQKPVIDNKTIKDNFSFVISDIQAEYNADTQKMRFLLGIKKSGLVEAIRRLDRLRGIKTTTSKADDLDEANLYSFDGGSFSLFFDEANELAFPKNSDSKMLVREVSLDVEEAKRLKSIVKAVVVVKLNDPYIDRNRYSLKFQVKPIEFFFFDPQKRVILGGKFSLEK